MSNNVAEYTGFVKILLFLKEEGLEKEEIVIRGDSKLVIEQMCDRWRIKQGAYVPHALYARSILKPFTNIKLLWVSRDDNEVCDDLAKDILRNMNIRFRIQPE